PKGGVALRLNVLNRLKVLFGAAKGHASCVSLAIDPGHRALFFSRLITRQKRYAVPGSGVEWMESEKSLRVLARHGALASYAAEASGAEYAALTSEAYGVAWPVVFSRLTRKLELRRGHAACATSVRHLTDDCLDRFYDDVEAVV